jgi:hypothetical protein
VLQGLEGVPSQVTCSNRRAAVRLKEGRSAESRGVVVSRDHYCKKEGVPSQAPELIG